MSANDKQVAGTHYAADVQHWDIVVMHNLNYFEGQITKYVMRARKKNGKQDLEKARHFIDKYLEVYDKFAAPTEQASKLGAVDRRELKQAGLKYVDPQFADEAFSIEGYHANGTALYKCRHCGWEGWHTTNANAHALHGSCAGKGYVAQG